MRVSWVLYEVVRGKFVLKGLSVLISHTPRETPQYIEFGRTGVKLYLTYQWWSHLFSKVRVPKLYVPKGVKADLVTAKLAVSDSGTCVNGEFVMVKIYD